MTIAWITMAWLEWDVVFFVPLNEKDEVIMMILIVMGLHQRAPSQDLPKHGFNPGTTPPSLSPCVPRIVPFKAEWLPQSSSFFVCHIVYSGRMKSSISCNFLDANICYKVYRLQSCCTRSFSQSDWYDLFNQMQSAELISCHVIHSGNSGMVAKDFPPPNILKKQKLMRKKKDKIP